MWFAALAHFVWMRVNHRQRFLKLWQRLRTENIIVNNMQSFITEVEPGSKCITMLSKLTHIKLTFSVNFSTTFQFKNGKNNFMPRKENVCVCVYLDLNTEWRSVCWLVEDWRRQVGQTESTAAVDVHHLITAPGWHTRTHRHNLCVFITLLASNCK